MKKSKIFYLIFSVLWLLACGYFILPLSGEAGIFPALVVTILTAPFSILVFYVFSIANFGLGGDVSGLLYHATCLGIGYWQWFFLLPKIIEKFKKKKKI